MARGPEDLYEKYAMYVYRYLFSLSGESDAAEELTQETFCQAIKGLKAYRGDSTPQVWLCAIARRLWFKELKRRARVVPAGDACFSQMTAPDDPARETEARQERLLLYQAMEGLDADTREVIRLRLAGEFSFREIGEILGRSEVWARVRFYRGKEKLAEILGGG